MTGPSHNPTPAAPTPPSEREAQADAALGIGLFALLRKLEREAGDRPPIGENQRLRDAVVRLGQDPFLAFPDNELSRLDLTRSPPLVRAQFMGFFGPQGALPLNWTEEILRWFEDGDEAFTAFADIFAARFQELFFRVWSDSHRITQFDHPASDRFSDFILAFQGLGTPQFRDLSPLPDTVPVYLSGLATGRVKSPVRLRQMLSLEFEGDAEIEIEEMIPVWIDFEPDDLSRLGQAGATLGMNVHLGSRVRSVGEKFRIHIRVPTLALYRSFLPGGRHYGVLRALIRAYIGQTFDVEIMLWLPEPEVQPTMLDGTAQLGWMACVAPRQDNPDHMISATRFALVIGGDDEGTQIRRAA